MILDQPHQCHHLQKLRVYQTNYVLLIVRLWAIFTILFGIINVTMPTAPGLGCGYAADSYFMPAVHRDGLFPETWPARVTSLGYRYPPVDKAASFFIRNVSMMLVVTCIGLTVYYIYFSSTVLVATDDIR
ncbi:LHFPL tetraspan subfamily member 3 protein [Lates japonicus]|uniref:LHFPL tetraspan subfamily member 3 protein n=1 Tax=Lates japonicus TaxID=270547 RepID=A0AAD3NCL0_LATJO|nr:LHFPL tetraspan subfamily member 3 protein [Lates japonicus]